MRGQKVSVEEKKAISRDLIEISHLMIEEVTLDQGEMKGSLDPEEMMVKDRGLIEVLRVIGHLDHQEEMMEKEALDHQEEMMEKEALDHREGMMAKEVLDLQDEMIGKEVLDHQGEMMVKEVLDHQDEMIGKEALDLEEMMVKALDQEGIIMKVVSDQGEMIVKVVSDQEEMIVKVALGQREKMVKVVLSQEEKREKVVLGQEETMVKVLDRGEIVVSPIDLQEEILKKVMTLDLIEMKDHQDLIDLLKDLPEVSKVNSTNVPKEIISRREPN
jgi:hypothetical protein